MEKQLIPQLRFPEFVLEYKKIELKKIATFNPKSEELPESFIYIDLESVKNGLLVKERKINKSDAPSRAQRLLRKNDIIYQTVRPYQKNNYFFNKNATDYVASTGYAQIRTNQVSQYLYQYLHTQKFVNKVLVRCTGTSYPAINSTDLSKISINVPSLPEQQKIASFLTAVDDKITKLTKKKDLLEQYKKGIMQKIFKQELRFKDDEGNAFPDWEVKKLGEVGKIITGSTPSTFNSSFYNGEIHFVSPSDIQSNRFIKSTKSTITELGLSKSRKIKKGSVLFVCIGSTIGKVAQTTKVCSTNQQINAIEPNSSNNSDFIYSLLEFRGSKIKLLAGTQAVPQINKTDFSNIKFSFPSFAEQTKIANFLSDIDIKIEVLNTKIENSKSFKKGLLQQMFV